MGTPAQRQAMNQAIPVRPTVRLPYNDSKRSPSCKNPIVWLISSACVRVGYSLGQGVKWNWTSVRASPDWLCSDFFSFFPHL
ncbi:hypothetical protein JCM12214_19180 [Geobacillus vulcani]